MGLPLTLSAGLAALLLTGCAAARPAGREHAATQPGSTVASSAATGTPVGSATPPPSTPVPTTTPVRASSSAPVPQTRQVVLRPVTATGRPAPGYTLVTEPADEQLACGGPAPAAEPSAVAVDDGIAFCGPSAAYAVACWPGPTPDTARCFRDPWQRQVVQIGTQGPLPSVRAPQIPTPLGLELSDGTTCSVRDGGAWGELAAHPELVGMYSCDGNLAVWASRQSDGIDRSDPLWRVRIAPMSGHGTLRTVAVRAVYYVGTAATP